MAHRFRVPLMAFRLTSNLVSLLPRQNAPRNGLTRVKPLLVANNPTVRLADLLEVVHQIFLPGPNQA